MTHSVKRHLDVDAEACDVEIRRFIPHDRRCGTAICGALRGRSRVVLPRDR